MPVFDTARLERRCTETTGRHGPLLRVSTPPKPRLAATEPHERRRASASVVEPPVIPFPRYPSPFRPGPDLSSSCTANPSTPAVPPPSSTIDPSIHGLADRRPDLAESDSFTRCGPYSSAFVSFSCAIDRRPEYSELERTGGLYFYWLEDGDLGESLIYWILYSYRA